MEILELRDFAVEGIFTEADFDRKIGEFDWSRFADKSVRVSNCGLTQVPGWVYLQVGIQLAGRARKVFFGDVHSPKRIYKRETESPN
jgi:hypothetical protein